MRKVLVVAALALSLTASGVLANTVKISDPQGDTEGVGGKQAKDIRSVTAGHTKSGKLKFTIVFWNRNAGNDYRPQVNISLVANDPSANCDQNPDYEGLIQVGNANGQLYRLCTAEFYGSYKTQRPNGKTFIYKFSPAQIQSPAKFFWGVKSNADQAPNDSAYSMAGWGQDGIKHKL